MAPLTSPKPPMMVAAKAFSAMIEPMPIDTNNTGPTSTPASPPSAEL